MVALVVSSAQARGRGRAIAGVRLSHPGPAHWGIAVIAASVTGAAAGMFLAARHGQAHKLPIAG